ncbi:TerD family protein [Rugamonas sp. CCM 8940]|uniref:TerD family protein n=1 Tax=Rugamonas sp. CCM 8940 TaxID=2765359 RepID=UPI0018F73A56|nr:TerD family protein [Rugamonas sp. CCM 8940]MBJ7312863.1 TerD family protein [Rugamonas sp. CCM 8940]
MKQFTRGQKSKLSDLDCGLSFNVDVDLRIAGAMADVSCFGLDSADRLSDDRYMVFYNQLASPGEAVTLRIGGERVSFAVNLAALPESICKLVFTAAIDGGASMRSISGSSVTLAGLAQFALAGSDFQDEKAVILAELYRKDGLWRFGAVGQGFNGGLAALLAHFGGSESGATASAPTPAPATVVAAPAPAAQPKVSLSKVTLEKRGDKISLEKTSPAGFGRIHVNLNWNRTAGAAPVAEKPGFFSRLTGAGTGAPRGIDLDLGCMFEMADGTPGVVQALGNSFGDFAGWPYIQLAADDRTGASVDGENLTINGKHFGEIKRALIFAFIYEGVANWAATDGVVSVNVPDQPPIEVRLDQGGDQMMCAIAMLENVGGKLQVTKLVDYIVPQGRKTLHELMDRKYNFGLRWAEGSKD